MKSGRESRVEGCAQCGRLPSRGIGYPRPSTLDPRRHRAFTLIEIMLVVGIIAIVMGMGIPAIYQATKRESIRKAAGDLEELCRMARAQAIMSGNIFELVIRADGEMFVAPGRSRVATVADGQPFMPEDAPSGPAPATDSMHARLPESVAYEMIKVDGWDYMASDDTTEARIRFHPNGLCDDMRIVLRSDQNERRGLQLEITTGLTTLVTDPRVLAEW